jgi:hypothetical protein
MPSRKAGLGSSSLSIMARSGCIHIVLMKANLDAHAMAEMVWLGIREFRNVNLVAETLG